MWLLLVGTGYSTIVHVEGARSYHAFVFPGIIVMAALFGAMLTGVEFFELGGCPSADSTRFVGRGLTAMARPRRTVDRVDRVRCVRALRRQPGVRRRHPGP